MHDADGAMTLREFRSIRAQNRRQVAVDRRFGAKRADHVDLPRSVVDVVIAANHMRDLHVEIVDDDAKIVRRRAVAAGDDQVIELGIGEFNATLHLVVPCDAARMRILESYDRSDTRWRVLSRVEVFGPPTAIVAWLFS